MGQRDDLLAGARKCIVERGYAHTTARDIVAASGGANLAAIGYHFGSKEALLNQAVLDSFDEWGDAVEAAMLKRAGGNPLDRLEAFLHGLLEGAASQRPNVIASVHAFAQAEYAPEIRTQLTQTYENARRDVAALLLDVEPDAVADDDARRLGSLVLGMINGLMLQWMLDPATAPNARDLAEAIRLVSGVNAPSAVG